MPYIIQEIESGIGFNRQSALQTSLADASIWRLAQTSTEIGQSQGITENNAEDIGKGDEWSSQLFKSHRDAGWPWNGRLSSQAAAMLATFGLGKVTKAAAGSGWKYTCIPMTNADGFDLPATTVVQKLGAAFQYDLIGMVLQQFGISLRSGPGRDNATFTSNWSGCGKVTNPGTLAVPAATTENLLNAGGTTSLTIHGVDYLANKRFVSLDFLYNNNPSLDGGFYPGSGIQDGFNIRGRIRRGRREVGLNFVVEIEDDSDELDDALAQTEGTAVITVDGDQIGAGPDKHQLKITLPRIVLRPGRVGEGGGYVTVATDCEVLKHSSNGVLTIEVTTTKDGICQLAA